MFLDYLYQYHVKMTWSRCVSKKRFLDTVDRDVVKRLQNFLETERQRDNMIHDHIRELRKQHVEICGENACEYQWFVYRYHRRPLHKALNTPRIKK